MSYRAEKLRKNRNAGDVFSGICNSLPGDGRGADKEKDKSLAVLVTGNCLT